MVQRALVSPRCRSEGVNFFSFALHVYGFIGRRAEVIWRVESSDFSAIAKRLRRPEYARSLSGQIEGSGGKRWIVGDETMGNRGDLLLRRVVNKSGLLSQ